jgi:hypothetical protein
MAIEEIIRRGEPEPWLAILEARLAREDDEECRIALEHALGILRDRRAAAEGVAGAAAVAAFLQSFRGAEAARQASLLASAPPSLQRALVPHLAELVAAAAHPLVQARVLRTWTGDWPAAELPLAVSLLRADSLAVRLAALELLARHAPDRLWQSLPRLLVHPEPRLRGLAIRGLLRLDPAEAFDHLAALFRSADPQHRRAALLASVHFPFDQVKPLFLELLARETDSDLLERVLLIVRNNPDPDLPFQILELADEDESRRIRYLQPLVLDLTQALAASGLLPGDEADFRRRLQEHAEDRAARRWVHRFLTTLDDREPEENEVLIEAAARSPVVARHLAAAPAWDLPPAARTWLAHWLNPDRPGSPAPGGQATPTTAPPLTGEPPVTAAATTVAVSPLAAPLPVDRPASEPAASAASPATAAGLRSAGAAPGARPATDPAISGLIRWLAALDADGVAARVDDLRRRLQAADTPPAVLAVALRTLRRTGSTGFLAEAEALLGHADPRVVGAALEYLGAFSPERLALSLGRFLKAKRPAVRRAALKALRALDQTQALSALRMMIEGTAAQQKMGLECLIHFEFAVVRDLVGTLIRRGATDEIRRGAWLLLANNPGPENFPLLFALRQEFSAGGADLTQAAQAERLLAETFAYLDRAGRRPAPSFEALLARLQQEWEAAEARRRAAPKPYSAARLHGPGGRRWWEPWLDLLRGDLDPETRQQLGQSWRRPALVGLVMLGLAWFGLLSSVERPAGLPPQGGPLPAVPTRLQGVVVESAADWLRIATPAGEEHLVMAPPGTWFSPQLQQRSVALTILPFRREGERVVRSTFVRWEAPP